MGILSGYATFYVRDKAYDGEIHRFDINPWDRNDIIIRDHDEDDLLYELSMVEFGEEPTSTCVLFRKLIQDIGFWKASMSTPKFRGIFHGPIEFRFAILRAETSAKLYDKIVKRKARLKNNKTVTAGKVLEFIKEFMRRRNESSPSYDVLSEGIILGFDIEMFSRMYDKIESGDLVSSAALESVERLYTFVMLHAMLGSDIFQSDDLQKSSYQSYMNSHMALSAYYKLIQEKEGISDIDMNSRKVLDHVRLINESARITREHQVEL